MLGFVRACGAVLLAASTTGCTASTPATSAVIATPKAMPATSESTPRALPRAEILIEKTWSRLVAGTNLLVGYEHVQTLRPDGYLRGDTVPFGKLPIQPGIISPASEVVDILGDWPNDAWVALRGSGLVEVFRRRGPDWIGGGVTSGECDPGIEADTCGPYVGIGRWTGGRIIYPLIRPRGKRTGPPDAQVLIEPIQWEFEFPPMFFVGADGSDKGLPKLVLEPGFSPRAFRSDPSGHAILVGAIAPRDWGLAIHRWRPGSLEPSVLQLDHLLFTGEHEDVLVVAPGDVYLLAARRAAAPMQPPADGDEPPARHDAMVLLHLRGGERGEMVIEADWARDLARAPNGTLWFTAGRGEEVWLVRVREGQPPERLALPDVVVEGKPENVVEVEGLYASSDTVVDVLARWGRKPMENPGLLRMTFAPGVGK